MARPRQDPRLLVSQAFMDGDGMRRWELGGGERYPAHILDFVFGSFSFHHIYKAPVCVREL